MGFPGIGAKVSYSTDGGSTFTDIVEVMSATMTTGEIDQIENNHLGITDGVKQYVFGLSDSPEISFKCNASIAQFAAVYALKGVSKVGANDVKWKITSPDENGATTGGTATYTMKGTLVQCDYGELVSNGLVQMDCKVKGSGGLTIA